MCVVSRFDAPHAPPAVQTVVYCSVDRSMDPSCVRQWPMAMAWMYPTMDEVVHPRCQHILQVVMDRPMRKQSLELFETGSPLKPTSGCYPWVGQKSRPRE